MSADAGVRTPKVSATLLPRSTADDVCSWIVEASHASNDATTVARCAPTSGRDFAGAMGCSPASRWPSSLMVVKGLTLRVMKAASDD